MLDSKIGGATLMVDNKIHYLKLLVAVSSRLPSLFLERKQVLCPVDWQISMVWEGCMIAVIAAAFWQ